MRIVVCSFFVFLSTVFSFSQTQKEVDALNDSLSFENLQKDLQKSKSLLISNIELAEQLNYKEGAAISNSKLAIVYNYLKETDKAYASSIKAIEFFQQQQDFSKLAEIYSDLGFVIKDIDLQKGLDYFRKAIKINEEHDLGELNEKIYNNYGILQKMKPDLDSALFYHQSALAVAKKYNMLQAIPYDLNNIAVIYSEKGDYTKAFEALRQSDELRRLENNDMNWADNLAYRADVFYEMKQADSAIKYYSQSLSLAQKTDFQNLIKFCLTRLSELYEQKNDPQNALKYYKLLEAHKDSIVSSEAMNTLVTLEQEFDLVNKEKKISEQNVQMLQQQNKLYISVFTLLLLILFATWFFLRVKRKKKEELAAIQHQKELETAEMEKEFVEEKLRISRELHDNIGSQLTFMISSVDNLVYTQKEEQTKTRLEKISNFGRATMKELRSTIWAMKYDGGNHKDLSAKLTELKLSIPEHINVQIIDSIETPVELNGTQMLGAYRIIQEALQNSVKYADASEVKIIFSLENQRFVVSIEDDGNGFDTEKSTSGNGLFNMKKRCEDGGGALVISSSNKGTTVQCSFPYNA